MKRTVAALIWFYTGWTTGAFVDYVAGINGVTIGPALGVVLGTAAAAIIAGDPRHLIWNRRASDGSVVAPSTQTAPNPA